MYLNVQPFYDLKLTCLHDLQFVLVLPPQRDRQERVIHCVVRRGHPGNAHGHCRLLGLEKHKLQRDTPRSADVLAHADHLGRGRDGCR